MGDLRPYRLAILLHPETSGAERAAVETLVREWASGHAGRVEAVKAEEKRRLSYPMKQQRQATVLHCTLAASPEQVRDLKERLGRERVVLRHRLFAGLRAEGKRLAEVPLKRGEAAGQKVAAKGPPPKEKAPLEKLEEKIDEILKEEVL